MNNFNSTDIRAALSNSIKGLRRGTEAWKACVHLVSRVNTVTEIQEELVAQNANGNGDLKEVLRIICRQDTLETDIKQQKRERFIEDEEKLHGEKPSNQEITSFLAAWMKSKEGDGTEIWCELRGAITASRDDKMAALTSMKKQHQSAKAVGQAWAALFSMKDLEEYSREQALLAEPGMKLEQAPSMGEHAHTILSILQ
ncbi:hypothetical protein CMI37_17050 [Candidatus Pacearchaeota archaeon]|nr:hypothetical protein [Candidatus Pacearchaeota archaeon]